MIDVGRVLWGSGGYSNMQPAPMVYVFTNGRSGVLGFSLQKCGANLPPAASQLDCWSRAYEVRMSDIALDVFRIDAVVALSDLRSCGYHVSRPSEDTLTLPKHHRGSS